MCLVYIYFLYDNLNWISSSAINVSLPSHEYLPYEYTIFVSFYPFSCKVWVHILKLRTHTRTHTVHCPPYSSNISTNLQVSVSSGSGAEVGTVLEFSCTSGHHVVGSKTITCQDTGSWSAPVPVCAPGAEAQGSGECVYNFNSCSPGVFHPFSNVSTSELLSELLH